MRHFLTALRLLLLLDRDQVDDVLFPDDCASRQATCQNLGERREVGGYLIVPLCAARSHTKSADNFVKNQNDPVIVCDFSELLEELPVCWDETKRTACWLQDNAGDVRIGLQALFDAVNVVRWTN